VVWIPYWWAVQQIVYMPVHVDVENNDNFRKPLLQMWAIWGFYESLWCNLIPRYKCCSITPSAVPFIAYAGKFFTAVVWSSHLLMLNAIFLLICPLTQCYWILLKCLVVYRTGLGITLYMAIICKSSSGH